MARPEIWILGATGRTGRAVATQLHEAGLPLVLAGRDRSRLEQVAAELGGAPRLFVGPLEAALAELPRAAPAVVVNTVGPFVTNGRNVARACPAGTHYVDVANELEAVQQILELDKEAAASNRTLVTAAGFGVLATESVILRLCEGQPPASRVRVDSIASVALVQGSMGSALAGSLVDGLLAGGREVRQGRLVRAGFAREPMQLTTPDGDVIGTASAPSGELLAAWRASKAESVVGASSMMPTSTLVRWLLPLVRAFLRLPGVSRFATRRMAQIQTQEKARPRVHSWAHARAEWSSGAVREGWFRAGDAMDFTVAVMAEVALRLARGEGRPGAYTPGALFGPELAVAAGAEVLIDSQRATAA